MLVPGSIPKMILSKSFKDLKLNVFKYYSKNTFFISLLVFVFAFAYVLYNINNQQNLILQLTQSFSNEIIPFFILIFILQFLNWTLEAIKFKILLPDPKGVKFLDIIKSVYVGNLTALITPKRLGNFIGRNWFLKRKTNDITLSTVTGNIFQLLATLIMAFSSFFYLFLFKKEKILSVSFDPLLFFIIYGIALIIIGYLLFTNNWESILKKIRLLDYFNLSTDYLDKISFFKRFCVLIFALLRYWIFILQYYILFSGFGLSIDYVQVIVLVSVLFGIVTFLPSIAPGNLGTREAVSIFILGGSFLGVELSIVSFIVWIVNVVISGLIGAVILISSKKMAC